MPKKYRNFSPEFREEAARMVKPLAELVDYSGQPPVATDQTVDALE